MCALHIDLSGARSPIGDAMRAAGRSPVHVGPAPASAPPLYVPYPSPTARRGSAVSVGTPVVIGSAPVAGAGNFLAPTAGAGNVPAPSVPFTWMVPTPAAGSPVGTPVRARAPSYSRRPSDPSAAVPTTRIRTSSRAYTVSAGEAATISQQRAPVNIERNEMSYADQTRADNEEFARNAKSKPLPGVGVAQFSSPFPFSVNDGAGPAPVPPPMSGGFTPMGMQAASPTHLLGGAAHMLASSLQQSGYAQQGVVNYAQQGVYTAGPVTSGAVHVTTAHVHQPAPTTMLTTETYRMQQGPYGEQQWILESSVPGSMPASAFQPPSRGQGRPNPGGRMAGWLLKRGPKLGMKYLLRYCILEGRTMRYCEDEAGEHEKGTIDIAGTQVRAFTDPGATPEARMSLSKCQYGFEIFRDPMSRTWYFDAGNPQKLQAWLQALRQAAAS